MRHSLLVVVSAILLLIGCEEPTVLTADPSSVRIESKGDYIQISVTANKPWTASSNQNWCTVSPLSGEMSGVITITCTENPSMEERSAIITLSSGEIIVSIDVLQEESKGMEVSQNVFKLTKDQQSFSLVVTTNTEFQVFTTAKWISLESTKATSTKELTFSVSQNNAYDARFGSIKLALIDDAHTMHVFQEIEVYQEANEGLFVSQSEYSLSGEKQILPVEVIANMELEIIPEVEWIKYVETKALTTSQVILEIEENGTCEIRKGIVHVNLKNGALSDSIIVKQIPSFWPATALSITTSDFNGYIDRDYRINLSISPEDAQCELEWAVSNERVAEIIGGGQTVSAHTKDFGKTRIIVRDKVSGLTDSISLSTIVTNFVWREESAEQYFGYPLVTIFKGESHQLKYGCSPSYATHLFEDLSNFVFYEPNIVVNTPTVISIDSEGTIVGLKEGIVGIKPTGNILNGGGSDRLYIKVVSEMYENEYNDDVSFATSAIYGIPMKFSISSGTDVDWFKLPLPKGGSTTVQINVTYEDAASLGSESRLVKYALYSSNMTQWGAGSFMFDSTTSTSSTTRSVSTDSYLFLKVFFDTSQNSGLRPSGILTLTYSEN